MYDYKCTITNYVDSILKETFLIYFVYTDFLNTLYILILILILGNMTRLENFCGNY